MAASASKAWFLSPSLRAVALWVGLWTGVGVILTFRTPLPRSGPDQSVDWLAVVLRDVGDAWVVGFAALVAIALTQRFPLSGPRWLARVPWFLLGWFTYMGAVISVAVLRHPFIQVRRELLDLHLLAASIAPRNLFIFALLVAGAHALRFARLERERRLRELHLRRAVSNARFRSIEVGLSLRGVVDEFQRVLALIPQQITEAERLLLETGARLRRSLELSREGGEEPGPDLDDLKQWPTGPEGQPDPGPGVVFSAVPTVVAFTVATAILAVLFGLRHVAGTVAAGVSVSWVDATLLGILLAGCHVGLLFWPALWAARRRPLFGDHRLRGIPFQLGVGLAAILVFAASLVTLPPLVLGNPVPPDWGLRLLRELPPTVVIYTFAVGGASAVTHLERLRRRETAVGRMEAELAEAQLRQLEMQVRPHFLFNSLTSVAELLHQDPEAAHRMLTRLKELVERSLDRSDDHLVPLEEELELVEKYLDIEGIRFGDRLVVEWEVDDEARGALVPQLVLQPIVENAVRHGISPSPLPGRIRIVARRSGGEVTIRISDDGTGPGESELWAPRGNGIGLANTTARLQHLFPGRGRLTMRCLPQGGTEVVLAVPFRHASRRGESVHA